MPKHQVIVKNLLALSGGLTFSEAVKDWTVRRIVDVEGGSGQTCELCGTRFYRGAIIAHLTTRATVLVGGTCLTTVLSARFPVGYDFREASQRLLLTLGERYGAAVDPGDWVTWVTDNAPDTLAHQVADLVGFRTIFSDEELRSLIQFHDDVRLFRSEALLGHEIHRLKAILAATIPEHMTINHARRLLREATSQKGTTARDRVAADYAARVVEPRVESDSEYRLTWRHLSSLERRALTALTALDDWAAKQQADLCPAGTMNSWPAVPPLKHHLTPTTHDELSRIQRREEEIRRREIRAWSKVKRAKLTADQTRIIDEEQVRADREFTAKYMNGFTESAAGTITTAKAPLQAESPDHSGGDAVAPDEPRTHFVWNPHKGVGFVGERSAINSSKAMIKLWRTGSSGSLQCEMSAWRSVRGCSEEAVDEMETLAFGRPFMPLFRDEPEDDLL